MDFNGFPASFRRSISVHFRVPLVAWHRATSSRGAAGVREGETVSYRSPPGSQQPPSTRRVKRKRLATRARLARMPSLPSGASSSASDQRRRDAVEPAALAVVDGLDRLAGLVLAAGEDVAA